MDKQQVIQDEQDVVFKDFTHELGFNIAQRIVEKVKERQLKSVGVRILLDELLIFQYLMDGKTEDKWLKRKEKTVLDSGHSSLYVFFHQDEYSDWLEDNHYAVCGGGFPIIINGEVRGVIGVSGLKHDEDHELLTETVREFI
ncbi:heme-binding protein [Enterococcus sp. AZ072]|uniref:heme-binding protein n=1 Tax=unclassified Enterococcus TaxID=2608891 RepID=UPI003D2A1922